MKKYYFLFGADSCASYSQKEDIQEFTESYNDNGFSATLFIYQEGLNTPVELLAVYSGNEDYICLSEEEYNELKEIL
jgi:hypothetical protein